MPAPTILLLSRDLMIGSQVVGTARSLGLAASQANSVEELLAAAGPETRLVLLDLAQPDIDVAAVVARLASPGSRRVVAFGPHVHAGLLAAARAAGCDAVLTRGQFIAQLPSVLACE